MTTEPNIYNPIGWAHLQLRGGMRNTVATTIGYTIIISLLIFATVRFNPLNAQRILSAWVIGLLGLQAGILLLFGCLTVGAAVRLDHTSKMIESHRLMPTSAPSAILGYVFGGPCQALAMGLSNFVIGAVVASSAQVAFARWAMANAIFVSFVVFVWVVMVFFGFLAQTAFRWIVSVFSIAFWMSQGYLLLLLPGVTVLASPLMGHSIFSMRLRGTEMSWEYILSFAAQILIGGICFVGATRKYRRADTQALGADLGLLLLASWIALSFLGMHYWDSFSPTWLPDNADERRRFLATMIATLLVMIVPMAGAARAQVRWNDHLRVHDIVMPRRPISPLLIAVVSAVLPLILTLTLNFPRDMMIDGTLRTAILFLSFALTISYMLRMLPLGKKSVWVVPIGWIFLTFAGPILIDLFYHSLLSESRDTTGILSTLSPPAALFDIWSINPIGTDLALVVQAAQAIAVMIIFYLRRRTTSPPLSPPSPTPSFLPAN
jgi:hypothetical protein